VRAAYAASLEGRRRLQFGLSSFEGLATSAFTRVFNSLWLGRLRMTIKSVASGA
jgi:hypothetical protein